MRASAKASTATAAAATLTMALSLRVTEDPAQREAWRYGGGGASLRERAVMSFLMARTGLALP